MRSLMFISLGLLVVVMFLSAFTVPVSGKKADVIGGDTNYIYDERTVATDG